MAPSTGLVSQQRRHSTWKGCGTILEGGAVHMPHSMQTFTTRWLCGCVSSFNNRSLCLKLVFPGSKVPWDFLIWILWFRSWKPHYLSCTQKSTEILFSISSVLSRRWRFQLRFTPCDAQNRTRVLNTSIRTIKCCQIIDWYVCDQMTAWFFQYLAIYRDEYLHTKFDDEDSRFCQI